MSMAENTQYLSGWTLTPTKILDELKAFLLAEQQAQEWDVLSEKEWGDMENIIAEDPILVGAKRHNTGLDDGRSYLTSTATNESSSASHKEDTSAGGQSERKKGSSGWTKVKSRSEDQARK
jgi:hypothetical protein